MPIALALAGLTLAWFAPAVLGIALLILALLSLVSSTGLKLAAAATSFRRRPAEPQAPMIARLPSVSVIVALYRESDIAPGWCAASRALTTRANCWTSCWPSRPRMPPPRRAGRRRPAALDARGRGARRAREDQAARAEPGLDHCRGAIIGIYDAEDAPDPDQIRKVVDRFHRRGPEVACLQGVLDYYNPRTNWLSRCFTIEYATWFRLVLPGIQRLGLAVPLGGTTLFFRRSVLEELGGWDAHNVTEDADLGIRLYRHGYRTELLDTVTGEEANCRVLPWIKQRSRWIKGYMMTWAVHMRNPRMLWSQIGGWRFAGFQVMFLGSLLQFLLAPLMWSFWLVPLGIAHPLAGLLGGPGLALVSTVFILSEVVNIALGVIALRRSGHRVSPLWVPTLQLYFPLAAVAAYKGLWELMTRPFYWDKTHHGIFDPAEPKAER